MSTESTEGSVTRWLGQLQSGEQGGTRQLWERYFPRLVRLARKKLHDACPRVADEEDVALSAFDSFCRGAEQGRYPDLFDRDGLWRLLVVITARKAAHLLRDEGRLKRGGAAVPVAARDAVDEFPLADLLSREPSPAFSAEVAEECRRLLRMLGDPELQRVALWKMEGFTTDEIAARLGYVPRSVKRKVRAIRELWQKELAP